MLFYCRLIIQRNLKEYHAKMAGLCKGKGPVFPFHGITSLYSYFEEI